MKLLESLKKHSIHNQFKLLYLSSSKLLGMFLGYINIIFLGSLMPVNDFGIYKFYFHVLNFIAIFFEFGFFTAGSRLIALNDSHEKKKKLVSNLLVIMLILLFLNVILQIFLCYYGTGLFEIKIDNYLASSYILGSITITPFLIQQISQAIGAIKALSVYSLIVQMTFFLYLLNISILQIDMSIISLIKTNLFLQWIALFIYVYYIKDFIGKIEWELFHELFKEVKKYGLKVYLSRAVDTGTYSLDSLMIGMFFSSTEVAIYSIGISIFSSSTLAIFQSYGLILYKDLHKYSMKELKQKILQIYYFSFFIIIFVFFLASLLVIYFLNNEYHYVFNYLILIFLLTYISSNNQLYYYIFQAKGFGKEMVNISFIAIFLNIFGNLIFIPLYGISGAFIASLITLISTHTYMFYIFFIKG